MVGPPTLSEQEKIMQASVIYATSLIVILFWDYLNTLHTEVRFVWIPLFSANQRRQWRKAGAENRTYMVLSPVLFFVIRYLALVEFAMAMYVLYSPGGLNQTECLRIQRFFPFGSVVIALCASAMMSLRVIALWENAQFIKWPLLAAWCATAAVSIWGASYTTAVLQDGVCAPVQTSPRINAFYLSIAVFDAIVVALTLLRAVRIRHSQFGATGPLFRIMVRDGLIYFVLIFSANMLAAAFQLQDLNPLLKPINATLATIMTSIFGARIYFNIRQEVYALRNPRAHFARYDDEGRGQRPKRSGGSNDDDAEYADESDESRGTGGDRLTKRDSDRTMTGKAGSNSGWKEASTLEEAATTRNNSITHDSWTAGGGGKQSIASPHQPVWTTSKQQDNASAARSYDPNLVNFDAVLQSDQTVTHIADTLSPIAATHSHRRQANAEKNEPITRSEWA